ncbi:hypothetical protein Tco_0513330 [Tanacetum coccineum]
MQAQEKEELSIEEKATLFQQLLEKRRMHLAAKRAEEKRNKPPIKAQQRKIMCTYLKDLKLKEFDSIQEMFDKAFKRGNTFEDFRIELVEGKEKRAGIELIQEITKKQKVEDDKETTELKYQMLKSFNREDLEDLYKLVKAKYKSTRPVEDLDLLLWGDFKTMFEPHVEDKIYMLVEKKYPLAPLTLSMMLEKKLIIDYEISFGIKRLHDDLGITAAKTSESGPVPSRLLLLEFLWMVVGNYRIVVEKDWYATFVAEVRIVEKAIGDRD